MLDALLRRRHRRELVELREQVFARVLARRRHVQHLVLDQDLERESPDARLARHPRLRLHVQFGRVLAVPTEKRWFNLL